MPLNDAILDIGANAMRTSMTHLSLHPSLPNASGTPETSATRVLASFPAASNGGDLTITNKSFTGGAASGACQFVGFWSAVTSGTFYGSVQLTGDQTFNTAGEYTITSLTVTGTST